LIHEHYLEVDNLLSGELPTHIVQSFAGRKRDSGYSWADLEDEARGGGEYDRPSWERHTSAWKVKKKRDSIDNILGDHTNLNDDEERDVGEGTRLVEENIEQREARREKIARLALNSMSLSHGGGGVTDW
jgi:hypothetical protein